jgi:putative ABC transport system substrate-binding protein
MCLDLCTLAVPASAQQVKKVYRMGILTNLVTTDPQVSPLWEVFRQALAERGWVEGHTLVIERRYAMGQADRFPVLAAELATLNPDLIVAVTGQGALAAKHVTSSVPIVMVYVMDPFEQGLINSLANPGANVTGLTFFPGLEIVGKHLELLKETVPKVSRVGLLLPHDSQAYLKEARAAAQTLKIRIQPLEIYGGNDLESAFAAMVREHSNAMLVIAHPLTFAQSRHIAEIAAKRRAPVMFPFRESVEAGGLMAYAANAPEMFRRLAVYVDKIFKGAKPADLPVEQPTKFELIINLKTAKQIGLTIPPNVLARADRVIK